VTHTRRFSLPHCVATAFTLCAMSASAASAEEAIVDAFNTNQGGQKPGVRSSNPKGQCVKGRFMPTAQAHAITRSASFAKEVSVLGRFSMGSGNVKIADGTKMSIRGFGFKLDPQGPATSEFAFINTPIFFAKNLSQLLGFAQARHPGADGKPDASKIKAFAEANPETTRQSAWLASKPVPASFAEVSFWGIHAYVASNSKGTTQTLKFKLSPSKPGALAAGLSDDEAKAKPADFLVVDLTERLSTAAVDFDLLAVLAQAGDATDDPTSQWANEDSRPTVKLGTLRVTALEDNSVCDATVFNPTVLANGLTGAKDDALFAPRALTYGISLGRRAR
jgi:catalase